MLVRAGDFDHIADLAVGGDFIILPNGYQPYVSYFGSGGDVIVSVAGSYNVWVDGGAPLTVTQVQAQVLFQ